MIAFAWILLLAAANRVELVNEDYQIAPSDWQWVPIGLKQRAGMVSAVYQVRSGSGQVRLVLMRREDIEDMPHGALAETTPARNGGLGHYLREPGEYALVVENTDARAPANVHLTIWLDFSRQGPPVGMLSRDRQIEVIVISFAVFFGIVTWSAKRLLRAIRKDRVL